MTELIRYVIVAVMCEAEEFNQLRGCGDTL